MHTYISMRDLTGQKFGRLTVTGRDPVNRRPVKWMCRCECGTEKSIYSDALKRGRSTSCGCYRKEASLAVMLANRAAFIGARLRHGMFDTPTHRSWNSMLQRCGNPNRDNYEFYGGRGICVCDRWKTFENFLADMGERPEGCTLDRYPNNNGNYEPGNCRWATHAQQMKNRRVRGSGNSNTAQLAASRLPDASMGGMGEGD